ncbi:MAG: hypothetical protein CL489_11820 [Acidobacteria bacterium]|nr:hypothetical protein [Acidobacteriota bacterium]|tara:strand:- start:2256 stop:2798 length:543 start_codon:yes stop_codon:yes gene_type:complete
MNEQVDVRNVVMSDSKDNETGNTIARKNDCIIKITDGADSFYLYKIYDCAPNKIQNLIRRFYHWLDNDDESIGLIIPNLIYFIKRTEEESDEGKFSSWQFDHHLKKYLEIIGSKKTGSLAGWNQQHGVRYIYEINTEKAIMKTSEGRWNPDRLVFENHKYCGEVPVGTNYDSDRGMKVDE